MPTKEFIRDKLSCGSIANSIALMVSGNAGNLCDGKKLQGCGLPSNKAYYVNRLRRVCGSALIRK